MLSVGTKYLSSAKANLEGKVAAIDKSQAVIEFSLDGNILAANQNFLKTMGYSLAEIKGKHHGIFVDPKYRASAEYQQFWAKLKRGEYEAGQYRRIAKDGKGVWLQATYNPILDSRGRPVSVVKFASDITGQKAKAADFEGQLAAIDKAQAVIEFALDGTILTANPNFIAAMGYASLEEIKGKHHSIFVEPTDRASAEYKAFWEKLRRGEYDARQYRRIGKGGREVWIQASYNPIVDADGKPYKVVKYATDITEQIKSTRMMHDVVNKTLATVDAAKKNDLTVKVPTEGVTGDLKVLSDGVNDLLGTLASVIDTVREAAERTATVSKVISDGSRNLASRTEQQASNLEETSATTEELSASVKQSADNARKATDLGRRAKAVAEKGGQVITDAVEAMERIDKSSKSISDIITVIDGIAFQTNLLALNAAVEAARAGDSGRGFAVVASEVRALAQRSADAAKDIRGLISDSGNQVTGGVALVNEAGSVLGEIVTAVSRVATDMEEIATAASEQSRGIEEISLSVANLDEITQQNSSMAEQSSTTAQELQSQIDLLRGMVAAFNTGNARVAAGQQSAVTQLARRASEMRQPPQHASAPPPRAMAAAGGKKSDGWEEF